MELEIKNKKENPVLQRQEITGEIKFTGAATPSNNQVHEELAKKLGIQSELVAIRHIYGSFGSGKAAFEAVAYATKEQFDKIEPKKKAAKTAPGAAPVAAAK
jgi:ribosomal protein S24E